MTAKNRIFDYALFRAIHKVCKSVITHWKSWKTHLKNIQDENIRISTYIAICIRYWKKCVLWLSTSTHFLLDCWHCKAFLSYGFLISICLSTLGFLCLSTLGFLYVIIQTTAFNIIQCTTSQLAWKQCHPFSAWWNKTCMCLWNTHAPGGNKVKIWQKSLSPTFWPHSTPRGMWCLWSVRNL